MLNSFLRNVLKPIGSVSRAFESDNISPFTLLTRLEDLLKELVAMIFPPEAILPEQLDEFDVRRYTAYIPTFDRTKVELLTAVQAETRLARAAEVKPLDSYLRVRF